MKGRNLNVTHAFQNILVALHSERLLTRNLFILRIIYRFVIHQMLKLYLAQQREIAKTKRNAITTDRLAQITDTGRVASARRFKQLLTLKEWGFIELETGATSQLKKISLRKFVD